MSYKLFVWSDILTDYSSGIAFALAETVDQARDLIVSAHDFAPDGSNKGVDLAAYRDWLTAGADTSVGSLLWHELQADPVICDEPYGEFLWGGG